MEERHTTPTSSEKIRFGVPQALKPVTAPPRKSNLMALMNDPEPQLEQETGNVHIMPASGNLEIDTGDQSNHIAEIGKRLEAAMEELNTLEHLDQLEELVNEGLSVGGRFPEMLALYSRSKDLKWLKKARELQDNPLELQDVTEIIQEGLKLHIHPDQSDLRYFQEQEVRGERWEAEAKEVLAVEPLDYPKLDLLLKQSAFIPVTPNTLSAVRTPLTKYQETGDLMVSLYKRSKNFDFHQRPKYKEMWDVMEAVSDINDKPFGFIDLEREQKRHEDWMRRGKKMFGMANAPLHALHLRMNQVEHRNQSCFDISDQPRMPVEPASREASPVEGESVDGSGSSRDVFCICRRPEADVMIECELCQEW
jgi:histone demethylase JARID1